MRTLSLSSSIVNLPAYIAIWVDQVLAMTDLCILVARPSISKGIAYNLLMGKFLPCLYWLYLEFENLAAILVLYFLLCGRLFQLIYFFSFLTNQPNKQRNNMVSLCSPGCPSACFVNLVTFKLRDVLASASQ